MNNVEQGIASIDYLDYSLPVISLSAKENIGIDSLRNYLKEIVGYSATEEGAFIARKRHLTALTSANKLIESALEQLKSQSSLELIAEDLRFAQSQLGTITGEFTSDDLLGEIFSNFCVGK